MDALSRSSLDTKVRVPTTMCNDITSEVPKPRDTVPQVLQAGSPHPWAVPLEGNPSNC